MRLSIMSHNYLLAPIQECPSDYLVKDVKLAVLGTGSVGKSGKRQGHRRIRGGAAAKRDGAEAGGRAGACFECERSRLPNPCNHRIVEGEESWRRPPCNAGISIPDQCGHSGARCILGLMCL